MEFLKTMGWVLLALVVLAGIFTAGKKGMFDKVKATNNGVPYTFSREKWLKFAPWGLGLLFIIGVSWAITGCDSGSVDAPSPVAARYCPSMMEGSIDMPSMADVALACNIDVKEAGLWRDGMTDAEAQALCSAPMPNNNNFGGGGAYGGRYLTGSFHFEFDANCQQIPNVSYVTLFSPEHYPVTGGLTGDGKIGMGSIGGTGISGSIVDGKLVDAKIVHGDGKHHIKGNFNGGFVLR